MLYLLSTSNKQNLKSVHPQGVCNLVAEIDMYSEKRKFISLNIKWENPQAAA